MVERDRRYKANLDGQQAVGEEVEEVRSLLRNMQSSDPPSPANEDVKGRKAQDSSEANRDAICT